MMKRILFFTLLFTYLSFSLKAQVGINTTNPKSVLDIEAVDASDPSPQDGILIPRVEDFTTVDPGADQDGMLVFLNTASNDNERGFYYWDNNRDSWIGFGGEWRDGTNANGDDLIFAIQADGAGNSMVITDDDGQGSRFGFGTDDPKERMEIRSNGDNDILLSSANNNPPNFIVQNTGGSVENPSILSGDREIGAFVSNLRDNSGNIRETGGVRFYADETPSGNTIPTRFEISLIEDDRTSGSDQVARLIIKPNGNIGFTETNPTARLHLEIGNDEPGGAPLKFEGGSNTLLDTPEDGAFEFDGNFLYITDNSGTRHQIATVSNGGGTVTSGFDNWTNANGFQFTRNTTISKTYTVPGASSGMTCTCSPRSVPNQVMWSCYVSGNNQVTVRMANVTNNNISGFNTAFDITVIEQ